MPVHCGLAFFFVSRIALAAVRRCPASPKAGRCEVASSEPVSVSFPDSNELNLSGSPEHKQNIILKNRIIRYYSNVIAVFWYPIPPTARAFLFFTPTLLLFIGTFHHFGTSFLLFARTFLHFIGTFYHFDTTFLVFVRTFLLFGTTLLFFGTSFMLQVDWSCLGWKDLLFDPAGALESCHGILIHGTVPSPRFS